MEPVSLERSEFLLLLSVYSSEKLSPMWSFHTGENDIFHPKSTGCSILDIVFQEGFVKWRGEDCAQLEPTDGTEAIPLYRITYTPFCQYSQQGILADIDT